MKVICVLFARLKRAKCTTKHATHILHAYRMSLASLWPNQVSCLWQGPLWHVVVLFTVCFGMNKHFELNFLEQRYVFVLCIVHISYTFFSNYIVNMVVCICQIIADCLGAIQVCVRFPARILNGKPTYMEVYCATHTFLGG